MNRPDLMARAKVLEKAIAAEMAIMFPDSLVGVLPAPDPRQVKNVIEALEALLARLREANSDRTSGE